MAPVHKKENKQIINNYRPIRFLKRFCSNIYIIIYFLKRLITNKQSGSVLVTTNQLIDLVNEIYQSFDHRNSYETRVIVMDISKAFDKAWHEGLLFKLRQNGVICSPYLEVIYTGENNGLC